MKPDNSPDQFKQLPDNTILQPEDYSTSSLLSLLLTNPQVSQTQIEAILTKLNGLNSLYMHLPVVLKNNYEIPISLINIIAITKELMRRSTEQINMEPMNNVENVISYLQPQTIHENDELIGLLCLDQDLNIISNTIMTRGTPNFSYVSPKAIFKTAISLSASAVILYHNHPREPSMPLPSESDLDLTKHIIEISKIMDVPVLDHVILGSSNSISLRQFLPKLWEPDYEELFEPGFKKITYVRPK